MRLDEKWRAISTFGMALMVLSCVVFQTSALAEPKAIEKPLKASVFRKGKDSVLFFEQGDDGETKFSSAMTLSAKIDGIVIVVVANEKHIEKAIGLAIKMRNVLQQNEDTPDHIPVVASQDEKPGAYFRFYSDGMYYGSRESLGIFGPAEAKKHLGKIVTHHLLIKRYVRDGRWGQDDSDAKSLQIISK